MPKKSLMSMEVLIVLIMVMVVGGTLLAGQAKLAKNLDEGNRIEACFTSIIAAEETKRFPIKAGSPRSYISCDRGELLIGYDDVVFNGQLDQRKLDRIVADSLKDAWDATAQGKHDPFPDWEDEDNSEFQSLCFVWDVVKFDKKLKNFLEKKKMNLSFSFDSLYTLKIGGKETTYSEYLFDKDSFPKEIESKKVQIDDGTAILTKQYRGNLIDFWWNPIFFVYYFGKKCNDCSYLWAVAIVPSTKSFSDKDIEIKGEKYRICDQIKN